MAATEIKNGWNAGQAPNDVKLKINPDGSINTTGSGGNASVGTNGDPIPGSSTLVAGQDPNGDTRPVSVDLNGFVNVQGISSVEGLNTFQTSQYTIGTSAVQLAPTALANRSSVSIAIQADTNATVYIGNSASVTTSTGYPLYNLSSLQLDLTPSGQIWAISDTPGQTAAVMEIA